MSYKINVNYFLTTCALLISLFLFVNIVFAQNYLPDNGYHERRPIAGALGWYWMGERFLTIPGGPERLELIVRNVDGRELAIRVEDFPNNNPLDGYENAQIAVVTKNYDQILAPKIKLWEARKISPRDLAPKKGVTGFCYNNFAENSYLDKNILPKTSWVKNKHFLYPYPHRSHSFIELSWPTVLQEGFYFKYFNKNTNQSLWILRTFAPSVLEDYRTVHNAIEIDDKERVEKSRKNIQNNESKERGDLGRLFLDYESGELALNTPIPFHGGEVVFIAQNSVTTGKLNSLRLTKCSRITSENSEKGAITGEKTLSILSRLQSFFVRQKVETQTENNNEFSQQKFERRLSTDITGQKVDAPRRDPIPGISSDWKFINAGSFGPPKTNNDPDEGAPYWDILYTVSGKEKTLRVPLDEKDNTEYKIGEKLRQAIQEDLELQRAQGMKK